MWRPQANASKATRGPRDLARSPSACKSAAARSMPPSESGDTLLQIMRRSQPNSCMMSNFRSARAKARARLSSGKPSKSRNGCRVITSRPRSPTARRTSRGVPLEDRRSFSKISTASNFAAAMASSFSPRLPLRETVAIEVLMVHPVSMLDSVYFGEGAFANGNGSEKSALHSRNIGRNSREQPERFCRLEDAHAGAADDARCPRASSLDKLGLERGVDHVCHPMVPLHREHGNGVARV